MAVRPVFVPSQILTAQEQNDLATAIVKVRAVTTASSTAVLADDGKLVTMSNASANTFTIPPNSSVAFGIGTQINISQYSTGATTIVAGAGVTLNSEGAKLKLNGQFALCTCVKLDTNEWLVLGNLKA